MKSKLYYLKLYKIILLLNINFGYIKTVILEVDTFIIYDY